MIPTTPTQAGYTAFLYSVVGIPIVSLPTSSGTATAGTTMTLTDSVQTWSLNEWADYALTDISSNVIATIASNTATTLTFTAALPESINVGDAYLIAPQIVPMSLSVALEIVNAILALGSCQMYTLAVYNLAADRLINYAVDATILPDQTYFFDERKKLRINEVSVGVPSAASDQGTATGILNPEFMKTMTLRDLQTLKTPWGRDYMSIALDWGADTWGLT
jgi:hypothetical protein